MYQITLYRQNKIIFFFKAYPTNDINTVGAKPVDVSIPALKSISIAICKVKLYCYKLK